MPTLSAVSVFPVPVLPLRDVVVFPYMVVPLVVAREKSVKALNAAMEEGKRILLLAQRGEDIEDPKPHDLYEVGTLATILQLLRLPDGKVKVLLEGGSRAKVKTWDEGASYFAAHFQGVEEILPPSSHAIDALMRSAIQSFEQFARGNRKIPAELVTSLSGIDDCGRLADTIAAHLELKIDQRQRALSLFSPVERLEFILSCLSNEVEIQHIEQKLRTRVKGQVEKNQREYYLNEQMKAIQKELHEEEEGLSEVQQLQDKLEKSGMPTLVLDKAKSELKKLKAMQPMSAEATVVRNYLDSLLSVPWKARSKIKADIPAAEAKLNADHYGLEQVKERILEYLAVQARVKKLNGPILCLVGPPGVGKTTLGRSIAEALNRKFVRMSLGGVRDEAEVRGHRRTYIGAMPGKIIQNLAKTKVKNPLFLLDEIDKMSQDFRGDPASALLEVLDPEQNRNFQDHYLEVDVDLSEVMFVATSNSLNIPAPLLDRMELIRIPGYTEDEKFNIAKKYLLPKALAANGVKEGELTVEDSAIKGIIRYYTREAGVRSLERELNKISRKAVKKLLSAAPVKAKTGKAKKALLTVNDTNLDDYLGVRKFRFGLAEERNQVGQVTGLAWTEVGGDLLSIEAVVSAGKGGMTHTGSLGNVMQESIRAALTVVRSRAEGWGIEAKFFQENDLHVHVPEGATPKDGPSAGIAMVTTMVSAITRIPIRCEVAMTGEITLRGEVLPIGGLKEKLLAAQRGGIKTVLIPHDNVKDLIEIPANIKGQLNIRPVRWIDEVLDAALESPPIPLALLPVSSEKILHTH